MALSLRFQQQPQQEPKQHSNFTDSQTYFDPFPLQQLTHNSLIDHRTLSTPPYNDNGNQMEYNDFQHHSYEHQIGSGSNDNTLNYPLQHTNSTVNHQTINTSRNFMSTYHNQHLGTDYEQVICFVDSPPNSEESWTDEPSKQSPPRPHIIDVQTIYSHSGSRKRRMDWDSLDIGHSENSDSASSGEIPHKIQNHDKEHKKRDKSTGRANWTDDIGFDLNSDFSNNSYLNNESFLTFSSGLSALKQEPQTEQVKIVKNVLNSSLITDNDSSKIAKSSITNCKIPIGQDQHKNARLNDSLSDGGSPAGHYEAKGDQTAAAASVESQDNVAGAFNTAEKAGTGAVIQQLSVVDASKIEKSPNNSVSHSEEHKFQYILAAATSTATKNNEETLTYLNQGQSYEIKLKKIGDLSYYRDKILKSVIKICFHERRLQYMEREQMQQWQASRPGERIIEVDVPLSYGLCHVSQPLNPNYLNTVELYWDPLKEVGVYVKVNCISTEFTPKKHGGEKGVPFRLQIETYIENTNHSTSSVIATNGGSQSPIGTATSIGAANGNLTPNIKQPVHAAACQIKVFKLKGADRKHKQDREKIQKRSQSEQEKFQPSYECTIMNDIPLDLIAPSVGCFSPEYMKTWGNSPVHIPKYDGIFSPVANSSPIAINSVTSTNSPNLKLMDSNMVSPQQPDNAADADDYLNNILPESSPAQVTQWLTNHRLTSYLSTFAHFSGSDIMRMSKEDLIQICGLADGIRMFNILRAKPIAPRLTFYVSLDGISFNAIYLLSNNAKELNQKLFKLPGFYEFLAKNHSNNTLDNGGGMFGNNWSMISKYSGSGSNIFNDVNKSLIYVTGPSGVHVAVTDDVLNNEIKDGCLYGLEVLNGKVVMKLINKNEN